MPRQSGPRADFRWKVLILNRIIAFPDSQNHFKTFQIISKSNNRAELARRSVVGTGVLLFTTVPQQFFPSAERNQFVIDVWMPPVSRLEQTDSVIQRIQTFLKRKTVVGHVATFAGQSFPRFYYNVSPHEPAT